MTTQNTQTPAVQPQSLKGLLYSPVIKTRFESLLKDKAEGFMSSILNVVNSNQQLANADPNSIIMAAAVAASLNLEINPSLGDAYIVPYNQSVYENGQWITKNVAQFQMGWKGFVQLAQRTGMYKTISVTKIRAGQLKKYNPLTDEFEFDFTVTGGEIIGYASYFKLLTGFEKIVYWNIGELNDHAKAYSKAYQYDLKNNKKSSVWTTNNSAMCEKTLVKTNLSKWGPRSIEMQKAFTLDQAVIKNIEGTEFDYSDSTDITAQPKITESIEVSSTTAQPSTQQVNTDDEL